MKRPLSHQIDEDAQGILQTTLPREWVRNVQIKDYGKDHLVEIGDGDELSGIHFIVQLKGQEKPKRLKASRHLGFDLEADKAQYYLDKLTLPVFLVLVEDRKSVV